MLLHENTQRVVFSLLSIYICISEKLPPPLRDDERFSTTIPPSVLGCCALSRSKLLIAGAFKEDSFLIGSYQPKNSIGNPSRLFLESMATNL